MNKDLKKLAQNFQENGYMLHTPSASNKDTIKSVA